MVEITFLPPTLLTETILLAFALLFSIVIGVERQTRLKSAGVRTHGLVGLGSALFTIVSAYGFADVLGAEVVLDPSRIAAQIVSGIGFLGAGVIFVRQNIVSGLTTAASIWVTAAVGMACGAGMPVQAGVATLFYVLLTTVLASLARRLPRRVRNRDVIVEYADGRGTLREVLSAATAQGYSAELAQTRRIETADGHRVEARMRFSHPQQRDMTALIGTLSELDGVLRVIGDKDDPDR